MRKPDREELGIVFPVFAAEAVVVVALFLGASIIVQGHVLFTILFGMVK